MPTTTLTYTAQVGTRVGNAFEAVFGLQKDADGNPTETQAQLVKRKLVEFVKGIVTQHEANVAAQVAHQTASQDAETNTIIT